MQSLTCDIVSTEHWVEHDGIKLYIFEKCFKNTVLRMEVCLNTVK